MPLRRAAASAGLFIAALLLVSLVRYFEAPSTAAGLSMSNAHRLRIHYANVGDKPADTYVIAPPDGDMVVVWVEKSL